MFQLLQIYQAKLNYLSWENLIEWITYIASLLLVIDFEVCQRDTGYRNVRMDLILLIIVYLILWIIYIALLLLVIDFEICQRDTRYRSVPLSLAGRNIAYFVQTVKTEQIWHATQVNQVSSYLH